MIIICGSYRYLYYGFTVGKSYMFRLLVLWILLQIVKSYAGRCMAAITWVADLGRGFFSDFLLQFCDWMTRSVTNLTISNIVIIISSYVEPQ